MTRFAIALLVVACGSASPDAPSNAKPVDQPPNLAGMTGEQRCTAVAAHTLPCMDELFNAESMAMVGVDLSGERKSDPAERAKLHEIRCLVGPEYTDAIVTCWNERGCQAFASCVQHTETAAQAKRPKREPDPEPLLLDP